jgi:cell division protease FtsH
MNNNGKPGSVEQSTGPGPAPTQAGSPLRYAWLIVAAAILIWNIVAIFYRPATSPPVNLPYSAFLGQLKDGNVSQVSFQGLELRGVVKTAIPSPAPGPQGQSKTSTAFVTRIPDVGDPTLLAALEEQAVQISAQPDAGPSGGLIALETLLPWVLFAGIFFLMRQKGGGLGQQMFSGFGQSRARLYSASDERVTFASVAGVDEVKADLEDVVHFLKEPDGYQTLGGRVPHGVLLVGPPGTGKTLLAKAVAGEANVPFFSISGSEFVEVLVGVGASRVRDLFEKAKKQSPSIVFIDEIDAVGRRRGISGFGSNDEREQTLNQVLVEMDGFNADHTVVVIAATNRADVLDPALLRPGRFDRQVSVERPDKRGREAILKVHVKGVPLASDVDLTTLARATPGMVGADLANLVNEAALLAAKRALREVNQQCLLDSLEKIQLGAERPLVMAAEDRRIVAYHEGGHALVALLCPNADPLNRVTIIPHRQALGVTLQLPIDDRYNYSRSYLMTRIAVALGGRVSEELVFGEVTTGAENDLEMVTTIIRQMVTRWGMDESVGILVQSESSGSYPLGPTNEQHPAMNDLIDTAMQHIAYERYAYTKALLSRNLDKLHQLANLLLEHESLDGDQIREELGLGGAATFQVSLASTSATLSAIEHQESAASASSNGSSRN